MPLHEMNTQPIQTQPRPIWCSDALRAARGALKNSLKNSYYDYQFVIDELSYRISMAEAEYDERMAERDRN